jgi:hypothetical protein
MHMVHSIMNPFLFCPYDIPLLFSIRLFPVPIYHGLMNRVSEICAKAYVVRLDGEQLFLDILAKVLRHLNL